MTSIPLPGGRQPHSDEPGAGAGASRAGGLRCFGLGGSGSRGSRQHDRRRRAAFRLLAAVAALLVDGAAPVQAADFRRVDIDPRRCLVMIEGVILPGDTDRLVGFLTSSLQDHEVAAFGLDSPGGVVGEGARLGDLIRRINASVVVGAGAKCESACFLLFAAGVRRAVMPSATIGIHSAQEFYGGESTGSMAATLEMARLCARWGTPGEIVSRMISTGPGSLTVLNRQELRMMNVVIGGLS